MGQHFSGMGEARAAWAAETVIQSPVISCKRRDPDSRGSACVCCNTGPRGTPDCATVACQVLADCGRSPGAELIEGCCNGAEEVSAELGPRCSRCMKSRLGSLPSGSPDCVTVVYSVWFNCGTRPGAGCTDDRRERCSCIEEVSVVLAPW